MRQSRFHEGQIIGLIKGQEAGMPTAEVCRRHGLSPASFYKFKAKYGGMNVSDTHRLKSLEDENSKLKRLLAVKHKCRIVMSHHAKKADGRPDPNPLESILGSTAITGACDTIMVLQKSDNGQAYTLHVTGKFSPDKSWNMVKTDSLFVIDEHAKIAALKRNKAQNAIYNLVKDNAGIKQVAIAEKLNKHKQEISRGIKKLLEKEYIQGSVHEGYTVLETPC